jgi:xylulose-5-phosphate/fructose-6-phosphate phosphoketolase
MNTTLTRSRHRIDRFHLVQDVIDRLPQLGSRAAYAKQAIRNALIEHRHYMNERGEDHPFVLDWKWERAGRAAQFHRSRQYLIFVGAGPNHRHL